MKTVHSKAYYWAGTLLCVLAVGFLVFALGHPELSFIWPNWVSGFIAVLYAIYTVLIFCMPHLKGASVLSCVILAVQFIALSLLAISVGVRKSPADSNWYLPAALLLTCAANFANLYVAKKQNKAKKENNRAA